MKKLTQERLIELLHYNKETGIFTRRIGVAGGGKAGSIAGYLNKGYVTIGIDYRRYHAHRLAWLYVYGYIPESEIDHIDKIRHHNWITNLREVSHQCNIRNTGNFSHNSSGVKGIIWCKPNKNWRVTINVNGKQIQIGMFTNFCEAVCARLAVEQCLDWNNCDSSSPAFSYIKKHVNRNAK